MYLINNLKQFKLHCKQYLIPTIKFHITFDKRLNFTSAPVKLQRSIHVGQNIENGGSPLLGWKLEVLYDIQREPSYQLSYYLLAAIDSGIS